MVAVRKGIVSSALNAVLICLFVCVVVVSVLFANRELVAVGVGIFSSALLVIVIRFLLVASAGVICCVSW